MALIARKLGTCAICTGTFKVHATRGRFELVTHGYQRPGHGYIVGLCFGAYKSPYELSSETCSLYKTQLVWERADREKRIAKLEARESDELWEPSSYRPQKYERGTPGYERVREQIIGSLKYEIRRIDEDQKRMTQLIASWTLRPLLEVDEEGRTPERKAAQETRKSERLAAREAKTEKAIAFYKARFESIMKKQLAGKLKLEPMYHGGLMFSDHNVFYTFRSGVEKVNEIVGNRRSEKSPAKLAPVVRLLDPDHRFWRAMKDTPLAREEQFAAFNPALGLGGNGGGGGGGGGGGNGGAEKHESGGNPRVSRSARDMALKLRVNALVGRRKSRKK